MPEILRSTTFNRTLSRPPTRRIQFASASPVGTEAPMKSRNLLEAAAASYDPATLKALGQAFDQAWASIAHTFPADSPMVGNARETLASALLSVAPLHSQNVDALRDAALQAMALNDRNG